MYDGQINKSQPESGRSSPSLSPLSLLKQIEGQYLTNIGRLYSDALLKTQILLFLYHPFTFLSAYAPKCGENRALSHMFVRHCQKVFFV